MKIQHTPGPYSLDTDGHTLEVYGPQGQCLATIHHPQQGNAGTREGNGQLFAAAPELLEALEDAANVLEFYTDYTFGKGSAYIEAIKLARAAIKKAKGE